MIYMMNSPVVTQWGTYQWSPLSLEQARYIVQNNRFMSAVGHKSTAEAMSKLLQVEVPMHRMTVKMETRDIAIIFRLKGRLEEGRVLSEKEIGEVGYEFGIMVCARKKRLFLRTEYIKKLVSLANLEGERR